MADEKTLGNLKTEILRQADMENSEFVNPADYATDPDNAELTHMVRGSIKELYDILVKSNEDYFIDEYVIATVAAQRDYDFPTDFYKFIGLDWIDTSGRVYPLKQYLFREREKYSNRTSGSNQGRNLRYRVMGSKIRLLPVPSAIMNLTLTYIPTPTLPLDDADTFDFIQGWDDWVKWDCVTKCLIKEESDPAAAMAERQKAQIRLLEMIQNRDSNEPQRVLNQFEDIPTNIDSDIPPYEDY